VNRNFQVVLDAIDSFQKAAKDELELGETPARAFNRCFEIAQAFTWFTLGMGEPVIVLACYGLKLPPTVPEFTVTPANVSHYLTWFTIEQRAVDFTARQFWTEAAHPAILTGKELAERFTTIAWPKKRKEAK
jgi:hypothetical protein